MASAPYVPDPSLPPAPEAVQKWLRKEDWEALTKAWQEAETQAILWAEASDSEEARMEELYQEASQASFRPSASVTSLPPLSNPGMKMRRKKPLRKWDEAFSLMGKDTGKPPSMRRYFDGVPNENTVVGFHAKGFKADIDPKKKAKGFAPPEHLKSRRSWVETHEQTVSGDNESLHPHLRSYFDRRGLESCYRQRPHVDAVTPVFKPRTPGRPSTRELLMRWTVSEPSLATGSVMSSQSAGIEDEPGGVEGRHRGGIHWGPRCQMLGTADFKVKSKHDKAASPVIPWVMDHHVGVAVDNSGLNPMLRHYFDADGLESSFRNRGHHYGRPPRDEMGRALEALRKKRSKMASSSGGSGDYDSVRSNAGLGRGSGAVSAGSVSAGEGSVGWPYSGIPSSEDGSPS